MRSGERLWDELVTRYDAGVASVAAMNRGWAALRPFIDAQHHAAVGARLERQLVEVRWWRDASLAYWQSLNELPLPAGHSTPAHPWSWYEAVHFDTVPGFLAPRIDQAPSCVSKEGEQPCVR